MKIAIVNNSGNVGKSIIANQLLKSRIPDCEIIAVESINDDGTDNEKLKGNQFDKIIDKIFDFDNAVLDIGSSNIESFLAKMKKFKGTEDDIDLFIVPTVNEVKQIKDTISIINQLSDMNIPKNRICVVFNKISDDDIITDCFYELFGMEDNVTINEHAVIYLSELFSRLTELNMSISDLADDPIDYRQRARAEKDRVKRSRLTQKYATKALAKGVKENLDTVFSIIFPDGINNDE
ncbi:StbB family protein [Photobacterium carnosum]|uniref:StbB family protein n=1 Tax=Photobacterium carnosum TaxID=2023717 RepID=UPI001E4FD9C7|nr:StbB family protein [Photobacterium carnosum]MCD9538962.1 StbB [Photobacterium carnosum]MCF2163684.1 StbB [Photobacterium carnosum]MCF2307800.1 StbB [Photobacterium carnosum]